MTGASLVPVMVMVWVLLSGAAFSVVDGDDVGEGDGFTVGEEVELEIALEGPIARVVDVEEVEGALGRQCSPSTASGRSRRSGDHQHVCVREIEVSAGESRIATFVADLLRREVGDVVMSRWCR